MTWQSRCPEVSAEGGYIPAAACEEEVAGWVVAGTPRGVEVGSLEDRTRPGDICHSSRAGVGVAVESTPW